MLTFGSGSRDSMMWVGGGGGGVGEAANLYLESFGPAPNTFAFVN